MSETALQPDERLLLDKFRQAKTMAHAGIEVAVRDGVLVRMNVTEKIDIDKSRNIRRLKET